MVNADCAVARMVHSVCVACIHRQSLKKRCRVQGKRYGVSEVAPRRAGATLSAARRRRKAQVALQSDLEVMKMQRDPS